MLKYGMMAWLGVALSACSPRDESKVRWDEINFKEIACGDSKIAAGCKPAGSLGAEGGRSGGHGHK